LREVGIDISGIGPNLRRVNAGAEDLEAVATVAAQQPLGHLATGGVARAQN
jgi:hypothetical protein